MTLKIQNETFTGTQASILVAFLGLTALMLFLTLMLAFLWIYYSMIRRNNSKNWTGRDMTEYVFNKAGMNVDIKSSFFYIKYWNYNKRKGTYRLRPWTHNRRSIWTLMEAAQQAWASSIRQERGKLFWLVFRLPFIWRVLGFVGAVVIFVLSLRGANFDDGLSTGRWIGIAAGVSVLFIGYLIADAGRIFYIKKNVVPFIRDCGLEEREIKAINRIYLWRLIYSVAAVIIELIKLALKIANEVNNQKSKIGGN